MENDINARLIALVGKTGYIKVRGGECAFTILGIQPSKDAHSDIDGAINNSMFSLRLDVHSGGPITAVVPGIFISGLDENY